jgi:hypothetical protein
MIAIPFAISVRPVAMSLGPTRNPVCNQCGQATPMIAIPAADDCRSLQLQVRCAVYNGTLGSGYGQRFQPANDPSPPIAIAA